LNAGISAKQHAADEKQRRRRDQSGKPDEVSLVLQHRVPLLAINYIGRDGRLASGERFVEPIF